jgi:apolipoprotein N-acyltransferase
MRRSLFLYIRGQKPRHLWRGWVFESASVFRPSHDSGRNPKPGEGFRSGKPRASARGASLLLSSLLLALPFSFGKLWILAWCGFVPLFCALRNKNSLQAFFLSYLSGFIFWWLSIFWLVYVTFLGTAILITYLAIYFGLFGFLFFYLARVSAIRQIFLLPSVWVLLEYLRSHLLTGFPWALLGYSQCLNLPVIQIADIAGAYGVSFLVLAVNVCIYQLISRKTTKACQLSAIMLLAVTLVYGFYKMQPLTNIPDQASLRISVVQGNIPQELKWDARNDDFILQKYLSLSQEVVKTMPHLIIWPEAASPQVLAYQDISAQQFFTPDLKVPLLLGAVVSENNNYFNSALLFSSNGKLAGRYDKIHLVPFGEYIPLKDTFSFLRTVVPIGEITAGRAFTLFQIPYPQGPGTDSVKFGVLICFEDLFPELSRNFVRRGADFLVNITNDGWYKRSPAAFQHLQASIFRAVENRRYLVRSANTGISAFISPQGKVVSFLEDRLKRKIFIEGYDTQDISLLRQPPTFYSRYADFLIFFLSIPAIYSIFRSAP